MNAARLCSVSIDLDGARHYHAIHALPAPECDHIVARGVERFLTLCGRARIRATVFVVTSDLHSAELRRVLQDAHNAGHELASHSHAHAYNLSRAAPAAIQADLLRSRDALSSLTGVPPVGFRAPGYNQSEALLDALEATGFHYDSSALAAPLYFAARASVLAAMRLRARHSASLVGDVRESLHAAPYRPRRGHRTRVARSRVDGRNLIEIPISGILGVPFIGTSLMLLGGAAPLLGKAVLRQDGPVVLELHAIDLCETRDVDPALAAAQPDVRVALDTKLSRLSQVLELMANQREVVPLATLASSVDV